MIQVHFRTLLNKLNKKIKKNLIIYNLSNPYFIRLLTDIVKCHHNTRVQFLDSASVYSSDNFIDRTLNEQKYKDYLWIVHCLPNSKVDTIKYFLSGKHYICIVYDQAISVPLGTSKSLHVLLPKTRLEALKCFNIRLDKTLVPYLQKIVSNSNQYLKILLSLHSIPGQVDLHYLDNLYYSVDIKSYVKHSTHKHIHRKYYKDFLGSALEEILQAKSCTPFALNIGSQIDLLLKDLITVKIKYKEVFNALKDITPSTQH